MDTDENFARAEFCEPCAAERWRERHILYELATGKTRCQRREGDNGPGGALRGWICWHGDITVDIGIGGDN